MLALDSIIVGFVENASSLGLADGSAWFVCVSLVARQVGLDVGGPECSEIDTIHPHCIRPTAQTITMGLNNTQCERMHVSVFDGITGVCGPSHEYIDISCQIYKKCRNISNVFIDKEKPIIGKCS